MEQLKAWATTLCFAAVAAGMAGILAPTGNLEKVYKFVVSVFFLSCVLVPLFQIRHISLPQQALAAGNATTSYGIEDTVRRQQEDAVKLQLNEMISECAKKYGVSPKIITMELSENSGTMTAKNIRVYVLAADLAKKKQVEEACRTQLGMEVDIQEMEGQSNGAQNAGS